MLRFPRLGSVGHIKLPPCDCVAPARLAVETTSFFLFFINGKLLNRAAESCLRALTKTNGTENESMKKR